MKTKKRSSVKAAAVTAKKKATKPIATPLAVLNKKESRSTMLLRLLVQAEAGLKTCDVSIADSLEFRRDQYGLSKSDFAALLGLTAPQYSEILSGNRSINKKAMRRAYAIGVPAEVLLQPDN